jgi:glycosyltransferase involved in cell wall biosynthesis
VRRQLGGAGALDGFVQNGGDYAAPAGLPMVTYQDSTVVQAVDAYPWRHLLGLSHGEVRGAGFVVDPGSRDELVEAMLRLCEPELAARLGALGREHAKQFTWRKVAQRLLRALALPGIELSGVAEFL